MVLGVDNTKRTGQITGKIHLGGAEVVSGCAAALAIRLMSEWAELDCSQKDEYSVGPEWSGT